MKKYLGWFAIALILSVLVNRQHEKYASDPATDRRNDCGFVFLDCTPDGKSNTSQSQKNAAIWWERAYVFFGWPNGTTIWALVITFAVIADQTIETRKAAEASLKQADIAARAVLLQFRPKLRVRSVSLEEKGESFHVTIVIANRGGLPAYIHDGKIVLFWLYKDKSTKELRSNDLLLGTVEPGSQHTIGMSFKGNDMLRFKHYVSEANKSPKDPPIRLRCEGTVLYVDDSNAARYIGFSRTHDVAEDRWITSTDTSREYHH